MAGYGGVNCDHVGVHVTCLNGGQPGCVCRGGYHGAACKLGPGQHRRKHSGSDLYRIIEGLNRQVEQLSDTVRVYKEDNRRAIIEETQKLSAEMASWREEQSSSWERRFQRVVRVTALNLVLTIICCLFIVGIIYVTGKICQCYKISVLMCIVF